MRTCSDPYLPKDLYHRASVLRATRSFMGIFRPPPAFTLIAMLDCVPIGGPPLYENTGTPNCARPMPAAAYGVALPMRGRYHKRLASELRKLRWPSPRR